MPPSNKKMKIDDEGTSVVKSEAGTSEARCMIDWRESANGFKERHKYAMRQGILTDVSFAVGPQGTLLSAHKMILALASPVFEVMFYGSLKETSETIGIPDLMPSGFQLLLDYIYTDEMEFKNETDALYAWFAADKYCLSHMREICCNYLSQCELTDSNVWIILENSVFLSATDLIERCLLYLKKNIEESIEAPGFLEISGDTLKEILKMDSLYINEVKLLKGIVRWSEEKIKNEAEQSLQQFLEPFLRYIRFGCMSQTDFVDFIDMHKNIISDPDSLAILKYMTDNRAYSLPDWCSHNVYPRKACEKRQGAIKKMTLSIRSYAIKPQPTSRSSELVSYHHSDNQLYPIPRNERVPFSPHRFSPLNMGGPSRRQDHENDYTSSSTDDDEDVENVSRRAVATSNIDSDDSSSSFTSSTSTDSGQSFSA